MPASDSWPSEPLQPLIPQSPWPISLTSNPVRPSLRYFMHFLASSEFRTLLPEARLPDGAGIGQHVSEARLVRAGVISQALRWHARHFPVACASGFFEISVRFGI